MQRRPYRDLESIITTEEEKNILGKVIIQEMDNEWVEANQLANFKQGKGDYGGIAGWSDDGADITAEVKIL